MSTITARLKRSLGYVVAAVIILGVVFVIKTFIVQSFFVPSGSMKWTLNIGDRILVDEVTPAFDGYHRGDIIVFRDPGGWLSTQAEPSHSFWGDVVGSVEALVGMQAPDGAEHLVKRVIGIPGDHVTCCNAHGQVIINGATLNESSYVAIPDGHASPKAVPFDVVVPNGDLWVLGDNRDNSADSRLHRDTPTAGFVPIADVVGRAFLKIWPLSQVSGFENPTGVYP